MNKTNTHELNTVLLAKGGRPTVGTHLINIDISLQSHVAVKSSQEFIRQNSENK